jgi:hypothetical protein
MRGTTAMDPDSLLGDACTLPTADRPLRRAEFDDLPLPFAELATDGADDVYR